MPATAKPVCVTTMSGLASMLSVASTATPTSTELANVPTPGRCRVGIHARSTNPLVAMTAAPSETPRCRARPWCRTSHGITPSDDRTNSAMDTPYSHSPDINWHQRRAVEAIGPVSGTRRTHVLRVSDGSVAGLAHEPPRRSIAAMASTGPRGRGWWLPRARLVGALGTVLVLLVAAGAAAAVARHGSHAGSSLNDVSLPSLGAPLTVQSDGDFGDPFVLSVPSR